MLAPSTAPPASYRTKLAVVSALVLAALLIGLSAAFAGHGVSVVNYRRYAGEQVAAFDAVLHAMSQEGDIYAVAAQQLPVAEAVVFELRSLTPPRGAREFHALLVETFAAYTTALDMIASVGDNPLLAIALAPSIRERTDFYHANIARLDFVTMRVRY